MLDTIVEFFKGFIDVITSVIDFVISFVQDLVYIVKLCATFVAKIPTLFGWLPTSVVTIVVMIFAIVVIYKIMGREG